MVPKLKRKKRSLRGLSKRLAGRVRKRGGVESGHAVHGVGGGGVAQNG